MIEVLTIECDRCHVKIDKNIHHVTMMDVDFDPSSHDRHIIALSREPKTLELCVWCTKEFNEWLSHAKAARPLIPVPVLKKRKRVKK